MPNPNPWVKTWQAVSNFGVARHVWIQILDLALNSTMLASVYETNPIREFSYEHRLGAKPLYKTSS